MGIRRIVGLAVLLSAIVGPAAAQPAPDTVAVTLASAVLRALEVSPDLGVAEARRDYAGARRDLARSSRFLTEFTATSGHAVAPGLTRPNPETPDDALYLDPDVRNDWNDLRPFNQVEVEAVQPIYTWGELGGNIRAATQGLAVEEAAVDGKRLDVALRTAEFYYNTLLTDELYRLAERTREVVDRAKREIARLLEEGDPDVDNADEFQVWITEQEFNRRVVEVTQQRLTARVALTRQLLLPEGTVVVPETDLLQPLPFERDSLDHYVALARANRPELVQAQAGLAARDALVQVARSDFFPKLFVGYSSRFAYAAGRYRQPNPYVSDAFLSSRARIGFGFRLKLNLLQTRARVEQARAEREEVRAQLTGAEQLVRFEVERAYRNLITAHAALDAQDEALRISKEWLQSEYIDFDLDLGDTENLVKAVQANLELEARYYEAVQSYNMAVLRLLDATGTLVAHIQSGILVE